MQGSDLGAPAQPGGHNGVAPQLLHLVVELEEGDGNACHLERRDVRTDEIAGDGNAALLKNLGHLAVHDVQFDERGAPHAVDKRQNLVALLEGQVAEDGLHQHLDDVVRRLDFHALAARLAVDADADLHLVLAQFKCRLTCRGYHARGQRHAHAAHVRVDALAQFGDALQVVASLGGGAADLLGEDGAAHAATASRVQAVLYSHVVVDDDARHLDALCLGHFGGHLNVHDVAGVVLDDVEHACAAVDGLRRLQHLVGCGACEYFAGAGSIQHASADEAAVHWLVPATSTGDDTYFALDGRIGADDEVRIIVHFHQIGMSFLDALKLLTYHIVWPVNQFL